MMHSHISLWCVVASTGSNNYREHTVVLLVGCLSSVYDALRTGEWEGGRILWIRAGTTQQRTMVMWPHTYTHTQQRMCGCALWLHTHASRSTQCSDVLHTMCCTHTLLLQCSVVARTQRTRCCSDVLHTMCCTHTLLLQCCVVAAHTHAAALRCCGDAVVAPYAIACDAVAAHTRYRCSRCLDASHALARLVAAQSLRSVACAPLACAAPACARCVAHCVALVACAPGLFAGALLAVLRTCATRYARWLLLLGEG